MLKVCKKCQETKALKEFYKERGTKDGHRNECKKCRDMYRESHRDKNRAEYNAWHVKYMKEHPLSIKQKNQNALRVLRWRYGLSIEDYEKMLRDQNGHCALCTKTKSLKGQKLAVDHCHKSKKIRGLLCGGCNRDIAILDNPEKLAKALAYLQL